MNNTKDKITSEIKAYWSEDPTGVWKPEQSVSMSALDLETLFTTQDWVFIALDTLALEVSQAYPRVMREVNENGKTRYYPMENHPITKLLNKPNKYQSGAAFGYGAAVSYNLTGNFLAWYAKSAKMMIPLRTSAVTSELDKNGDITAYFWSGDHGKGARFKGDEVLHIRRHNPMDLHWGVPPFLAGIKSVMFNSHTADYLNNFYLKGALPHMILETDMVMNRDLMRQLTTSFDSAYAGRGGQRRTVALPKGVKANALTHSIADQRLLDLVDKNRENILALLKVPPHAAGIAKTGSLGSEEHKTALKFMWHGAIKPMLNNFAQAMTDFFKLGDGLVIQYDTTEADIFFEDKIKQATTAKEMLATKTLNEVRAEIWELGPVEGGDVVGFTGQANAPQVAASTAVGDSSGNVAETGQAPSTTQPDNGEPSKQESLNDSTGRVKFDLSAYQEKVGPEAWKQIEETTKSLTQETIDTFQKFSFEVLVAQIKAGMPVVIKEIGSEISGNKTLNKDLESDIEDEIVAATRKIWRGAYPALLSPSVTLGVGSQLQTIFGQKNKDAIAALLIQDADTRSAMLSARGLAGFQSVSQTTAAIMKAETDAVIQRIVDGMEQGRTVNEIARDITDKVVVDSWNRSKTIARTETLTAVSIGQKNAIANIKKVLPDALKVWISANDEDVRDAHAETHGEQRTLDQDFLLKDKNGRDVPMELPRDVTAPPELTINCRCTVLTVAAEDIGDINPGPKPKR
jgi:HK97 family phage portal protein